MHTLTYVKNEDKISAAGKPYIALAIKVQGDTQFYNGLGNSETKNWKVGDQVEVELYQEEWNGKMNNKVRTVKSKSQPFKQYSPPAYSPPAYSPPAYSPPAYPPQSAAPDRLTILEGKVENIEKMLSVTHPYFNADDL